MCNIKVYIRIDFKFAVGKHKQHFNILFKHEKKKDFAFTAAAALHDLFVSVKET